jgi:hypothetical protein
MVESLFLQTDLAQEDDSFYEATTDVHVVHGYQLNKLPALLIGLEKQFLH